MLDRKILEELQEYVERNLVYILYEKSVGRIEEQDFVLESISPLEIETFIAQKRKPTLQKVLFNFIDKKGAASDAEIYKKAGIDRRHFSKIRSNPEYRPSKNTVIALALALELNKKETDKLLSSAGYSLSDSETFDLVIQFCIERKIYEIEQVNYALDYFSQKPLGGVL
ncbi:hypothetical protein M3204_12085 [Mesobacillus subterraneus]|uniref:hypothetical protein n=1 Tax=Mesobacillus subterraneus TaxID=285983 RepID=UPI00203C977D|nr:hypothetical protein [Mesobacillus subterraneus]MCM3665149.1 hypothetical protein [Mesobacillus subterraneus]MCM3684162.1 hypothetical protein [Mesobacillus subterraneus]